MVNKTCKVLTNIESGRNLFDIGDLRLTHGYELLQLATVLLYEDVCVSCLEIILINILSLFSSYELCHFSASQFPK